MPKRKPQKTDLNEVLHQAKRIRRRIATRLARLNRHYPHVPLGHPIAVAALFRLQSSFDAAESLIRKGFVYETWTILRLVFEQLAWVYAIHNCTDESLFRITPTRSLKKFKEFLSVAGLIYGELSQFAHIDPRRIFQYVQVEPNTHRLSITRVDRSASNEISQVLLVLILLYGALFEFIHLNRIRTFEFLRITKGRMRIRGPVASKLKNFLKVVQA